MELDYPAATHITIWKNQLLQSGKLNWKARIEGSKRGELLVDPNWTTRLTGESTYLQYHEPGNLLVLNIPEDEANGPGIEILDAQTGSSLGTIQTGEVISDSEYVESEELLLVTTYEDYLYAIETDSMEVRWETQAGSIGLVTDATAYLYSEAILWAYDLSSGEEQWEHVLPDSIYSSSLQWVNGTLVMKVGEFDDKGVVAITPSSGDEQWYYRPGDVENVRISDQGIYVWDFNGDDHSKQLARVDERTGAEKWSFTSEHSPWGLKVGEQSVFVQETVNGTAAAIDQVSGRLNWRSEEYYDCEGIWLRESALLIDGEGSYSDDFEDIFHAVDLGTGRTKWEIEIDQNVKRTDIESVADAIYLSTFHYESKNEGGTIYAVTERTGSLQWQYTLGDTIQELNAGANSVITRTRSSIYALDSDTGQPLWSLAGEDTITVDLATENRVVVNVDYEETHLLNREDGSQEGRFESYTETGGGALFVADGTDLSAYPVAENPEAFQRESPQRNSTPTEVFTEESDSSKEMTEGEGTSVFESANAGEETVATDDEPGIAFCPSCGGDLSELGDADFCPRCGSELPE